MVSRACRPIKVPKAGTMGRVNFRHNRNTSLGFSVIEEYGTCSSGLRTEMRRMGPELWDIRCPDLSERQHCASGCTPGTRPADLVGWAAE